MYPYPQKLESVPTIRIVSDEHAQGFVIINASDFDPDTMIEYDPAEEHDAEPSLPGVGEDLAALSVKELRERAKALGVSTRGTKADLQAALQARMLAGVIGEPEHPIAIVSDVEPSAGHTDLVSHVDSAE